MATLEKINSLTWGKLKEVLKDLKNSITLIENTPSADSRPYKVYAALLTQSGVGAPEAIILENTLGDIVWSREPGGSGDGIFYATSAGLFTNEKTTISHKARTGDSFTTAILSQWLDINTINLTTWETSIQTDGVLTQPFAFEIRVYN